MFWNVYQDNKASSSSNQSYDWVVYFIRRTNRNVSRCMVINLFLISSYPMSRFPIVRSKNQSVYYSSWFILYFSIIRVVTIIHYWSNSLDDWRVFNWILGDLYIERLISKRERRLIYKFLMILFSHVWIWKTIFWPVWFLNTLVYWIGRTIHPNQCQLVL